MMFKVKFFFLFIFWIFFFCSFLVSFSFSFVPPVKEFSWIGEDDFIFDSRTKIFLDSKEYSSQVKFFWLNLDQILGDYSKICGVSRYSLLPKTFNPSFFSSAIYFLKDTNPVAQKILDSWNIAIENDEGYVILINKDSFFVIFRTARGMYYAIQTIRDIFLMSHIKIVNKSKYLSIPNLLIVDYPTFSFRAVHLVISKKVGTKSIKNIIEKASHFKFNYLILQVNNNLKYATHPEISSSDAFTKEELRDIISFAKERYFSVIPELKLFCKQQKLLASAYPKLMQSAFLSFKKKKQSFCYDPNKEVYPIIFDLIRELLDLFQPEYFHIGHDECFGIKYNPPQSYLLFAEDVNRVANFLLKQGVKPIMWADMVIKSKNGKYKDLYKAINLINKSVIMVDWSYYPYQLDYSSVLLLREKGFEVIGATFKDERVIQRFSVFMKNLDPKPLGMIATTWYYVPWKKKNFLFEILKVSSSYFW